MTCDFTSVVTVIGHVRLFVVTRTFLQPTGTLTQSFGSGKPISLHHVSGLWEENLNTWKKLTKHVKKMQTLRTLTGAGMSTLIPGGVKQKH